MAFVSALTLISVELELLRATEDSLPDPQATNPDADQAATGHLSGAGRLVVGNRGPIRSLHRTPAEDEPLARASGQRGWRCWLRSSRPMPGRGPALATP